MVIMEHRPDVIQDLDKFLDCKLSFVFGQLTFNKTY